MSLGGSAPLKLFSGGEGVVAADQDDWSAWCPTVRIGLVPAGAADVAEGAGPAQLRARNTRMSLPATRAIAPERARWPALARDAERSSAL